MRAQMGVNLDYPKGRGDTLEFYPREPHQQFAAGPQPIEGEWFPDAFLGSMLSVQRFALGEADTMPTTGRRRAGHDARSGGSISLLRARWRAATTRAVENRTMNRMETECRKTKCSI